MKILIAEYASTVKDARLMEEGEAMFRILSSSFKKLGHEVLCPRKRDFTGEIEKISSESDAGLVIAPDASLGYYTKILEENTINLGCPSKSVEICADKLASYLALRSEGINAPEPLRNGCGGRYVIKPRYGCGSDNISVSDEFKLKKGYITTEYIEGDHMSVSLIIGEKALPLTVNKQFISPMLEYEGGLVPYFTPFWRDMLDIAVRCTSILGSKGYVGIDFVVGKEPWVIDVNPRITTSIIGISRVINCEIADLILKARFGGLPNRVKLRGSYSFRC